MCVHTYVIVKIKEARNLRGVGKGKDMERVGGNDVNFNNKNIGAHKKGGPWIVSKQFNKTVCYIHCYGVHDTILFRKDKAEGGKKKNARK